MSEMTKKFHEIVSELLQTRFEVDADKVTSDATFDDLDLDSLSQLELAMALRKTTGLQLTDDEAAELGSVGEIVAKLEEKEEQVTVR